MLLSVLEELGKIIKAAEQRRGKVSYGGPAFRLCRHTDTKLGDARFGKIPLSSMGPYPEPGYTGVFDLIFSELSGCDATKPEALMLNATDLKAHPTSSKLNKGCEPPA